MRGIPKRLRPSRRTFGVGCIYGGELCVFLGRGIRHGGLGLGLELVDIPFCGKLLEYVYIISYLRCGV